MYLIRHKIIAVFLFSLLCVACTKVAPTTSGGGTTTTGKAPLIKVFNAMNYGSVTVSLNNVRIGDVALYYPTNYVTAKTGTNNISVSFGGVNVVNVNVDLLADSYYSIVIYRLAFSWKIALVPDNLATPSLGKAKIRVLDFRTQAISDYVKVRISALGIVDQAYYENRVFLDHMSYSSYADFKEVTAGTYNAVVFNDSANLATRRDMQMANGKIYTLLMVTPGALPASEAIRNINLDWKNHN